MGSVTSKYHLHLSPIPFFTLPWCEFTQNLIIPDLCSNTGRFYAGQFFRTLFV